MLREELGDFCSITCFKSLIVGMEEALGEKVIGIALTTSGRYRGKKLGQELGLENLSISWELLADKLGFALGKNGTSLCIINKIIEEDNRTYAKIVRKLDLCNRQEAKNAKFS